ncbi:sigma-54-dependent transcriptional regulator [Methylogaea oryzae]|uniref:Sigma-54-dependent Fis family transcriptional regulator n=1 Tax=Methylogaea oryzae TaxID=1295382 RepID=A0A8D4VPM9_9GAMM|nr:sigma-54 dependent transcriptional regulator [Methylogaea oryzae]BBL72113.1 sigma-54-dependent Fis family transcriptional regulator [Methylogaea oryzae]
MLPTAKPTVLLVEDSGSLAAVYQGYLREEAVQLVLKASGAEAMAFLALHAPSVVLLDLKLPDMDGMDILKHIHEHGMPCSVVIITAHGSVDVAVDAMRYGAFDFIEKPFNAKRLLVTVRNALERQNLSRLVETYRENFGRDSYHGFLGASLAMQAVYRMIDSAAASKATVFITGESGTGKEVCADAIHKQSPRKDKPFVALNCAAIPRDLMESEIFGHVKGAFTGAAAERKGAAGLADGGTLFLDEICEMDMDLQSKLLRFIQTGTFQKVGASQAEQADIRFVCATNRDPWAEVQAGRFREDLFYRLHVIPIALPPLREREQDVLLIARHFLREYAREEGKAFNRFAPECENVLSGYAWPGNVRQLLNVIRNVVVLHQGEAVTQDMLPPPLSRAAPLAPAAAKPPAAAPTPPAEAPAIQPLWLLEKQAIEQAIARCDGNIPKAASLLEVSASTIYRKLQAWQGGA